MEGAVATTSQSEVHQDYQAQQQLQAIENGQNPWESRDGPNERLLRLARATAVQREKPRIQVGAGTAPADAAGSQKRGRDESEDQHSQESSHPSTKHAAIDPSLSSMPLPPGINSHAELAAMMGAPAGAAPKPAAPSAASSASSAAGKPVVKPPKPAGPPPEWALKNKPAAAAAANVSTAAAK
jgi:hypothetical protein